MSVKICINPKHQGPNPLYCRNCNTGFGKFDDSLTGLEKACQYLGKQ